MNIHIIGTRRRVTSLRPKEIENFSRKIALTAAVLAAFSVGCGARIVTNDASSEEQIKELAKTPVEETPPPISGIPDLSSQVITVAQARQELVLQLLDAQCHGDSPL